MGGIISVCMTSQGLTRTDGEHSDNAIDGHTDYSLAFFHGGTADDLYSNVDSGLLPKPHDLGTRTPVPANEGFVRTCGDEVPGGKRYGTNSVEMTSELL